MENITALEAVVKGFGRADEVRTFDKGRLELFHVGDAIIGRATFEPGWKWSTCLKPIAKTASCQSAHLGYQVAGDMHIVTDSGREFDIHKGDFFSLPPGHDGWVTGDESVVVIDFQGMTDYAKPKDALAARDRKH
jgi:hypothetical protein